MALQDGGWLYGRDANWASPLTGLRYRELIDSGQATFGLNSGADRKFIVNYDRVSAFVDDLLGYGWWLSSGTLHRHSLPDPHPLFARMYAVGASIQPFGKASVADNIDYISTPLAMVTAHYEPTEYYVKADNEVTAETQRFCSFKYGFQTQALTLQGGMKFETTGRILSAQPAIRQQILTLQVIWNNVPGLDDNPFVVPTQTNILALEGKINSATFLGFSPGTVLFAGADPVMSKPRLATLQQEGLYTWQIAYTFQIRDNGVSPLYAGEHQGWQYVFDIVSARYDRMRSVLGNTMAYQTGDLNTLFSIN